MEYKAIGKIIKSTGGLYYIKAESNDARVGGKLLPCRARGKFRHAGISPVVGDRVEILYNDRTLEALDDPTKGKKASEVMIADILDRKNVLIRPPLANLDYMFVSMAATKPAPVLSTVDKLISIAEFGGIEPVIIIGKSDLDQESVDKLSSIYETAGFRVFPVSAAEGKGVEALTAFLHESMAGKTAAFAGASGVGKSSLMNRLFPDLHFETGDISQKIERGKNTTRHVELVEFSADGGIGYIADTPGFSMLDFIRFDFFSKEDLVDTMRDFAPYIGECRYKKCTHTKEEGCAILDAVKRGEIAPSRHESFLEMYEALKNKHDWD